ncbi:MAG: tetratricopeptide repeat protein [Acidobacteriota bacterium]
MRSRVGASARCGFAGLLLLAFAADLAALPWEERTWRSFRTDNFLVLSDAQPSQARDLAADLETLRLALAATTSLELASPVPTVVFLFEHEGSMRSYKHLIDGEPATLSGAFYSASHADFLTINGRERREATVTVFHEYVHKVLRDNVPNLPLWLEEGLAELFSTFTVRAAGRAAGDSTESGGAGDVLGQGIVGLPTAWNLEVLASREHLPLEELLAVEPSSPHYTQFDHQGIFYAQSWALVHYLWLGGNETRRRQALDYLTATLGGMPRAEAFRAAFGVEPAVLEAAVRAHREAGFGVRAVHLGALEPVRVASGPLRHAEVLVRLGELLTAQTGREPEAERHFREALRLEREHGEVGSVVGQARALAGLGMLAARRGDLSRARALYGDAVRMQATQVGADDPLVHFLYGSSLVVFGRGTRAEKLLEARRHLVRSLELDPAFAPAWARLREVETHLGDRLPGAARPTLENADIALRLLVLYARAGDRAAARQLVADFFERHTEGAVRADAQRILARLDWLAAERTEPPELFSR